MTLALSNCGGCADSRRLHFKYICDTPGSQGYLPDSPTQLVCTSSRRIQLALDVCADVITIYGVGGNNVGSPTQVDGSCDFWTSPEASNGWPSVPVQRIIGSLPRDTMLVRSEFINGRQTIEVGFTNALIQKDSVVNIIQVGQYIFKRKSLAAIPIGMAGTIFSAQTYEIVK